MNGIIDVYEHYVSNLVSFQFDLHKRKRHSCLVCTTNLSDNHRLYSRKSTEKFIINYLEHLKVFGYSIKLAEIFIDSVRQNGILSLNVKGHWKIKKHNVHEIVIIEHCVSNRNLDESGNFFKNLLLKEKEKEEEEKVEEIFDINSELNIKEPKIYVSEEDY